MSAPVTVETLTCEMVVELRDSLRNGTPLTSDHALFTVCTNTLAAFKESAWSPGVWSERYFTSPDHRERLVAAINARREAKP